MDFLNCHKLFNILDVDFLTVFVKAQYAEIMFTIKNVAFKNVKKCCSLESSHMIMMICLSDKWFALQLCHFDVVLLSMSKLFIKVTIAPTHNGISKSHQQNICFPPKTLTTSANVTAVQNKSIRAHRTSENKDMNANVQKKPSRNPPSVSKCIQKWPIRSQQIPKHLKIRKPPKTSTNSRKYQNCVRDSFEGVMTSWQEKTSEPSFEISTCHCVWPSKKIALEWKLVSPGSSLVVFFCVLHSCAKNKVANHAFKIFYGLFLLWMFVGEHFWKILDLFGGIQLRSDAFIDTSVSCCPKYVFRSFFFNLFVFCLPERIADGSKVFEELEQNCLWIMFTIKNLFQIRSFWGPLDEQS